MHNGSKASLRDVIMHYSDLDEDRLHADGEAILKPLQLSPGEADDLLASCCRSRVRRHGGALRGTAARGPRRLPVTRLSNHFRFGFCRIGTA